MQISCENCRTKFDVSPHADASGACPFCAHVNNPGNGNNRLGGSAWRADSLPSSSNSRSRDQELADRGGSTMLFPAEAELQPDSETTLRKATEGKTPQLPERPFELVIIEGDHIGTRFTIDKPKVVIGRGTKADIQIKDAEASREHCMIEVYGEKVIIKDLKSANGTVINGFLIRRNALKPKDRIHIGGTTLELVRRSAGSSTRDRSFSSSRQR